MILKRLTVNNIRAYLGKAVLEFAVGEARNVTLIHGVNGAGKTSLFLALNWVLYGEEIKFSGHLLNKTLLRQAQPGELVSGSVALEFEHDGENYYLSRGISGQAIEGVVTERQSGLELYRIDSKGRSKIESLPQQLIDKLLPPAIRTFFFFDGDKIAEFTKPGKENDRAITKAVNEVLQLELLNRAATHLSQLTTRVNKEIAQKGSLRLKELREKIESNARDIENLLTARDKIMDEIGNNSERREKVNEDFLQIREVAADARRRLDIERELAAKESMKDGARESLMKANVSAFYLPLDAVLITVEDYLDEKRERKQIPGDIKDQLLMDMLEEKMCLCNRELLPGTPAFLQIEKLLSETVPSAVQELARALSLDVKRLLRGQSAAKLAILTSLESVNELESEIDKLHKEREGVALSIAKEIDAQNLDLTERLRQIDADSGKLNYEVGVVDTKIGRARKEREDLASLFRLESEKEENLAELRLEAQLTAAAADTFASIRESLVDGLKADMSAEATRIFRTFTWKTEFFKEVRVGDDYLIELFDEYGRDMRSVMSAGETQLLSLAFMLSMTAISDIVAPLVIDTPLARLDKAVRSNLLGALPSLTSQLVLFVTDSEMDSTLRPVIEGSVGQDYILSFSDGISRIAEGAFG